MSTFVGVIFLLISAVISRVEEKLVLGVFFVVRVIYKCMLLYIHISRWLEYKSFSITWQLLVHIILESSQTSPPFAFYFSSGCTIGLRQRNAKSCSTHLGILEYPKISSFQYRQMVLKWFLSTNPMSSSLNDLTIFSIDFYIHRDHLCCCIRK